MYDLDMKEFFVSRDVKFIKNVFPFASPDDVNVESSIDYDGEIHEDFVDIGLCDEECDDEMHSYDQGGAGTSREHRSHANLQQPTPSDHPADATSSSSLDADVIGSSARSSLPSIPAASIQQPSSTDAATQQQPLAVFEG